MFETQNENNNEIIVHYIKENSASEYTTPESTTSAQDTSQTGTSTNTQFVRIPIRIVSPRQDTHDAQSYSDEEVQDENQNITSIRDTSVNVSSPTRTFSNNTQNITRSIYDPSLPSLNIQTKQFNHKIILILLNKILVNTMIHFFHAFFPQSNTNIQTNNNQNVSQSNNNTN